MSTFAIKNPVGTISIVGRVPIALAFEGADDEFAADCACSGPRIAKLCAARRGLPVSDRIFGTVAEAVAAGVAIGVNVVPA